MPGCLRCCEKRMSQPSTVPRVGMGITASIFRPTPRDIAASARSLSQVFGAFCLLPRNGFSIKPLKVTSRGAESSRDVFDSRV